MTITIDLWFELGHDVPISRLSVLPAEPSTTTECPSSQTETRKAILAPLLYQLN